MNLPAEGVVVRPRGRADDAWACEILAQAWGSVVVVSTSGTHDATMLPGLVAEVNGQRAGLLTYRIVDGACEVVTLQSTIEGAGAATALLEAVRALATAAGCRRLWLITTNDNTPALRFYQRRGWDLVAFHRAAVHRWRALKPEIPATGEGGIPIAHALELELPL